MKKLLAIFAVLLFFSLAPQAYAAIAFDNALISPSGHLSNWSESFTDGSGSNRVLFVAVLEDATTNTVTGITYNSVAMTNITSFGIGGSSQVSMSVWFLVAPATGANNISVTKTGGNSARLVAQSYSGANQSLTYSGGSPTDNFTTLGDTATAASRSLAVTTIADNSWVIGFARTGLFGYDMTAGSGTTARVTSTAGRIGGDNNTAVTPAGSYTMNWNNNTDDSNIVISLSLSPASAPAATPKVDPLSWFLFFFFP